MINPLKTQPMSPETPAAARPSAAGAAQGFQPLELPIPKPFRTSKTFTISKCVLRSLILIVAIVSLGLMMGSNLIRPRYFNIYPSFAVASIIWNLAECVTFVFRRDRCSICPAVHMGVHMALWILAIIVVSFYSSDLASWVFLYDTWEACTNHEFECDSRGFPTQITVNGYLHMGIIEALTVLNVVLLILHFILFIIACVETERRRAYEKKKKVLYLLAAPGTADGRMYYTPLDQPLQGNEADGPRSQACLPSTIGSSDR